MKTSRWNIAFESSVAALNPATQDKKAQSRTIQGCWLKNANAMKIKACIK